MIGCETTLIYNPELMGDVIWSKGDKLFNGFCFSSTNTTDETAFVHLEDLFQITLQDEIDALKAHLEQLKVRMNKTLDYLGR